MYEMYELSFVYGVLGRGWVGVGIVYDGIMSLAVCQEICLIREILHDEHALILTCESSIYCCVGRVACKVMSKMKQGGYSTEYKCGAITQVTS